jgi:hypothetical protein
MLILSLVMVGCQVNPGQGSGEPAEGTDTETTLDAGSTSITFFVEIPTELEPGQELMIEFLDEITGLAIVPARFPMDQIDATHYQLTRDLPAQGIIKYRYFRKGENPSIEFNSLDRQVRYRFIFSSAAPLVYDQVAGWNDILDVSPTGMIEGTIRDSQTSEPAAGILVACGGDQVVSGTDGSYRLDKIKAGTHTLSALSMDGRYYSFQQEAIVAANSRTPADFVLNQVSFSEVKFILDSNGMDIGNNTIRIVGDLSQAGNTFSNQGADQSILAQLAPVMEPIGDGAWQADLKLPRGMVFTYKYSLGDGLWNSERDDNSGLLSRKILISDESQVIRDSLKTFGQTDGSSIAFNLKTPENTPAGDQISIQFNPFDWSPPLPMQKIGDTDYLYTLFGPQDLLGEVTYRYCRNGFCDNVPFSPNSGSLAFSGSFQSKPGLQIINDTIPEWLDWRPADGPTIVLSTEPAVRFSRFIGGFEIQPDYSPVSLAISRKGWDAVGRTGANAVFLAPTWQILTTDPLIVRNMPGQDPSLEDLRLSADTARQQNLKVGIFPRILAARDEPSAQASDLSAINPNQWSETINRFYAHFSRAAQQNSAEFLIIDSNYLDWRYEAGVVELLINIREQFKNKVLLAVTPADLAAYPEGLARQFDGVYLLLDCPLFKNEATDPEDTDASISSLLDGKVKQFAEENKLPVILGIHFPAVDSAGFTCYQTSSEWTEVRNGLPLLNDQPANIQAQTDLYNEILSAAASRGWVSGVVSRGFLLDSARTDASASVHGKPAADVLWYWFTRFGK